MRTPTGLIGVVHLPPLPGDPGHPASFVEGPGVEAALEFAWRDADVLAREGVSAIIIENFISLKRDKLAPPEIIDEIQALFDEGQYQEAMELCENEPSFFTRVCGAGIAKIGHHFDTIEKSIQEMGDEESIKLHQKIGWLSLIANVAPMMGLLGTVSGMVSAFNTIANSAGQASPAELAKGISQALLTTMFGLIVGIPVTAAFAFLRNRLVKTVIETGAIVEDLFERFREQTA